MPYFFYLADSILFSGALPVELICRLRKLEVLLIDANRFHRDREKESAIRREHYYLARLQ